MKMFFFTIFIFFITLPNIFTTENNQFQEQAQVIFKEMGLEGSSEITKNQFNLLFYRLITKDQPLAENNKIFYNTIVKKISEGMPNKIKVSDMADYMTQKRVITAIEDVVREQYGEQYVESIREQFTNAFDESEKKLKEFRNRSNLNSTTEKNLTNANEENVNDTIKHQQISDRTHNETGRRQIDDL